MLKEDQIIRLAQEALGELGVLRSDAGLLKSDISILKRDLAITQTAVIGLVEDVEILKEDVNFLKAKALEHDQRFSSLDTNFADNDITVNELLRKVYGHDREINELKMARV